MTRSRGNDCSHATTTSSRQDLAGHWRFFGGHPRHRVEDLEWHPEADALLARHLRTGHPYARAAFCAVVSLWIVAIAIAIYQHTRLVKREPQSCRSPPATGSKVRVRSDAPWLLGLLKRVSPTRLVLSTKRGHR